MVHSNVASSFVYTLFVPLIFSFTTFFPATFSVSLVVHEQLWQYRFFLQAPQYYSSGSYTHNIFSVANTACENPFGTVLKAFSVSEVFKCQKV